MESITPLHNALRDFAAAVTEKMSQLTMGEPEDQLRGPFENFMGSVAATLGWDIVCTGETLLPDRIGRPDYAVHLNKLLAGYVELKAPGVGAAATRFKGHNREQFKRFSAIPNILYTDGNEWALYRNGELVDKVVSISGDVSTDGKKAATMDDTYAIECHLRNFLSWEPIIPTDRKGKISLKDFAALLAPLCKMLRNDVADALESPKSPLVDLAHDWRQLLFPDASDEQFADAYAQTVTFALLLGRSEGAHPLTLESAENALSAQHSLLSRTLQILTDPAVRAEMAASLDLLLRIIAVVPPSTLTGPEDPWLYFYEDFLATYDPKLRKDAGAYYTPVEVVRAQVRLIDDLLVNRLGKTLGFADPGVITLDPAAGTGTYLLGVIEHALRNIESAQGAGAVPGQATALAENLYGFELMVGPYAVTELRVSRALRDRGADLPKDGTHIFLTDTLESPHVVAPPLPYFLRPIADQHAKAIKVKNNVPVLVCLGNPPYDRHEAATAKNKARTGGWVRWGDGERGIDAILHAFLDPAVDAGHGIHVKNLYNLYVYFWRWALWKVFEHDTFVGPGVVSFISASSYIDGDAFCGMREHMRRVCDEIWILDLGGEGRGARKSENVFAIQTPVAIAVAVRAKTVRKDKPAKIHYTAIVGTRELKLAALAAIDGFAKISWQDCPNEWQAPFRPAGKGIYFTWPLLIDLMPWQQTGVMPGRTWVISPDINTLERRWRQLCLSPKNDRSRLFKDSPTGCKAHETRTQLPPSREQLCPVIELAEDVALQNVLRYANRSYDRQYILADARFLDRPAPPLWIAQSERQVYITSLLTKTIGSGPAVTGCSILPDKDCYSARGAKDVVPLYRSVNTLEANILPGLLELLGKQYKHPISPEDFLAYTYGILAQSAFTACFAKELGTRELRVPITKNAELFELVSALGAKLLWLHTYGECFVPEGMQKGHVPPGKARCTKAVPGSVDAYPESFNYNDDAETLHVGEGEFNPVNSEIYAFEVSGLKVVQSWLKYRMKRGAGKKSSPLDYIRPERWTNQFTTELLELLWVLEATIEGYTEQSKLLDLVINGECFNSEELPTVPDEMRHPPKIKASRGDDLDFGEDE